MNFFNKIRFHWSFLSFILIMKSVSANRRVNIINTINPKAFTDKILHRILFDRRDILTIFSGKLESRDYVLQKTGDHSLLIDLIGTARNEEELLRIALPERFVAKANHMSGRTRIVDGASPVDLTDLGRTIAKWCRQCGRVEWGYQGARRLAVIERLMLNNGAIPEDYKFFCYDGKVHFIQVDGSRFSRHVRDYFDRSWEHLDVRVGYPGADTPPARPGNLDRMIEVAEALSAGVDFVRVDLYDIDGEVKFGELTCYPDGGLARFSSPAWNLRFGQPWRLPE